MVNRPQLSSIISRADGKDAQLHQALARAQDKYNLDVAQQLSSALVRGSTLQVLTPYTQASPLVVPSGWISPSLNAGFSNVAGQTVQYRKDAAGVVWMHGDVSGAAAGTVFTLPSGYRPSESLDMATSSSDGAEKYARLSIASDGRVILAVVNPTSWGSLKCSFPCSDFSPGVPSCFPFDVAWPNPYRPTLVLAQCMDVNAQSPSNLSCSLTDWVTVARGTSTLIRVRNIPGLLPSTSYSVSMVCL